MEEVKTYKVRGSHRTQKEIKLLLGRDPDLHSGFAGRGAFCVRVTAEEHKLLKENGIKINSKKDY